MSSITNDFYNAPEFFVEKIDTECAGNGNLRLLVYGKRGGQFIPLYTVVAAATNMLDFALQMQESAMCAISRVSLGEEMSRH